MPSKVPYSMRARLLLVTERETVNKYQRLTIAKASTAPRSESERAKPRPCDDQNKQTFPVRSHHITAGSCVSDLSNRGVHCEHIQYVHMSESKLYQIAQVYSVGYLHLHSLPLYLRKCADTLPF